MTPLQIGLMIAGYLVVAFIGVLVGIIVRKKMAESKIGSAEEAAGKILEEAGHQAEAVKREALVEARDEIYKLRAEMEQEIKERRLEIQRTERRLQQKEEGLDKKALNVEKREEKFQRAQKDLLKQKQDLDELMQKQVDELERISNLTEEEAKGILLSNLEKDITHEASLKIREIETRTKEEAERKSREIIVQALQKSASDIVSETTVSVVELPNDEMKGRIIGREGRNIRTLETMTGIDLIIDDTPEAVILSGFDPVRREVARMALEKLVLDGRIHPARIEEMVQKAEKEIENRIREFGEQAMFEAGVHGLHQELVKLLGRMKYRTSYGQNVLKHSVEVANIAGAMADELGVNSKLARRAGLLHDIGKSVDHEVKGTHIQIGADLAKRYRESEEVIHCIRAHHGDIEAKSIEAILVQAADSISGARPGARRETIEAYIKRLEQLEEIANSFEGVEKSYAIQAGREIRIAVKPEAISDDALVVMARDIAKRIEGELEYPGQIKVSVIRETRSVEYAK